MNTQELNELAKCIHEQNKAAGGWDIPRPRVQTARLIVTELAEATEAERKGRYADLEAFDEEDISKFNSILCSGKSPKGKYAAVELAYKNAFERHIKDSFEDEIADAVIRLLDFAASEGVEISEPFEHDYPVLWKNEMLFFGATGAIQKALRLGRDFKKGLDRALMILCAVAFYHKFDLWQHVELKLSYNATRPKMHGGKKF